VVSLRQSIRDEAYVVLSFATRELPEKPLQTVRPVDEIKMAHADQSSLVIAPLARMNAVKESVVVRHIDMLKARCLPDQPVVYPFFGLDDGMRRRKDGPSRRFQRRSVRVVFNIRYVWRPGVEAVLHVVLCEL
jgi:hypothetical protein